MQPSNNAAVFETVLYFLENTSKAKIIMPYSKNKPIAKSHTPAKRLASTNNPSKSSTIGALLKPKVIDKKIGDSITKKSKRKQYGFLRSTPYQTTKFANANIKDRLDRGKTLVYATKNKSYVDC
jgi:hypothetical protein